MEESVCMNKERKRNFNKSTLFMFAYSYLEIMNFSNLKELIDLSRLLFVVIFLFLASLIPDLLKARYDWNIVMMVLMLSSVVLGQFDGVTNYLTIMITMIGIANKDIKPYVRAIYFALIFGFISVLLLRFTGIISDRVTVSPRGITRYSFGFGSARGISEMYLTYCQLFVFLNFDKIKRLTFFLLFIPIIPINIFVDSRATTILCVLFLFLAYFVKMKKNTKKMTSILYRATVLTYFTSFFTIYLGSLLYTTSSTFWLKADTFLSSRLLFGKWYLNNFPIKLFGQWIPIDQDLNTLLTQYNTSYLMLDSGYMTMLIEGGLLITIVITTVVILALRKMKYKNNQIGLIVWLITALNLIQTRVLKANSLEVLLLCQIFELSQPKDDDK